MIAHMEEKNTQLEHSFAHNKKEIKISTPIAIIIGSLLIGIFILTGFFLAGKNKTTETSFVDPDSIFSGREFKKDEVLVGDLKSKVVIVEYSDLECPFCKQLHLQTMLKIEDKYKNDVAFVYRHFPLSFHPLAVKEAEGALCVREQNQSNYKKFIDKIFEVTPANNKLDPNELTKAAAELGTDMTKWNNCMESSTYANYVQEDIEDGLAAGVNATPNLFVLIEQEDGYYKILTKIEGARDEKYISRVLDQAIRIAK